MEKETKANQRLILIAPVIPTFHSDSWKRTCIMTMRRMTSGNSLK